MTVTVKYRQTHGYRSLNPGELPRPYIAVRVQSNGRHFDTPAVVDSGADRSLFHSDFAALLGLTLDPSRVEMMTGATGNSPVWHFDIYLSVAGKRFPARVGFSAAWRREFGLLGREDFFSAFQVGFNQRRREFFLEPQA